MGGEVAPAARAGQGWRFWLRVGVSAVLLVVLVAKAPDPDEMIPDRHHLLTVMLLSAAVVMTFVGVVLSAWRWQRVIRVFGPVVPLPTLVSHYLAGLFVGNVLPSTIGGDVLRISRSSTSIGSPSTAFASVALERLTGFVALPLIVGTGVALQPSILDVDRSWVAVAIALVTLGLLLAVLYLAGHPRIAGRFAEHENWMRFIGAVHVGVDRLRRDPRHVLPVLGTAVLYQASVVFSVGLIFRTLDLPIPVAAVMVYVPAVAMLQVLPLTFNGLGVREGALVFFLTPWGVGNAQAIAAGLLWFSAMLLVSVFGAPVFAMGHRRGAEVADPAR